MPASRMENGMHRIENGSSGAQPDGSSAGMSRLAVAGVVLGFAGLASAFWAFNGPRVFAEAISAAWVLCF
ncbi:MAG: hypothetical protein FD175_2170 [Beijerinckiaceae bacterium]|nr:MAG: hypothetical protein FD175_2170 [Beijerinckiaceae bacterium]